MPQQTSAAEPLVSRIKTKSKNSQLWRRVPGWDLIEYAALRVFVAFISVLPVLWTSRLAEDMGWMAYCVGAKRRRIVHENLDLVFSETLTADEKKRIAVGSFQQMMLSFTELFLAPKIIKNWQKYAQIKGMENMTEPLKRNKGVIVCMGHTGSWELMGIITYLLPPSSIVVRPLKNQRIYNWIQRLREMTHLKSIDKRNSIRTILSELKQGHIVAMAIDQWAGDDGIVADFFGVPTYTTSVPARLADKTGCALVPMFCRRVGFGRYEIEALPEVPLAGGQNWEAETTLALNRVLEREIRVNPIQWIWAHRRWKKVAAAS